MTTPIVFDFLDDKFLATKLGVYPILSAVSLTRRFVSLDMSDWSRSAFDTVTMDTLRILAISVIVAFCLSST